MPRNEVITNQNGYGYKGLKMDTEKYLLLAFQEMCYESLDPETFEKFEAVKKALIETRTKLKGFKDEEDN